LDTCKEGRSNSDIDGGVDPVTNRMNYLSPKCFRQSSFTPGQKERMVAEFETYRFTNAKGDVDVDFDDKGRTNDDNNKVTDTVTTEDNDGSGAGGGVDTGSSRCAERKGSCADDLDCCGGLVCHRKKKICLNSK